MNEIKFSCPKRDQHILCDAHWSGREINCPACQQRLVVPSLAPAVREVATTTAPPTTQGQSGRSMKYRRYEDARVSQVNAESCIRHFGIVLPPSISLVGRNHVPHRRHLQEQSRQRGQSKNLGHVQQSFLRVSGGLKIRTFPNTTMNSTNELPPTAERGLFIESTCI